MELNRFIDLIGRLGKSRKGTTAIEYSLIATLIALVIIGSLTMVGTEVSATYTDIATAVSAASN